MFYRDSYSVAVPGRPDREVTPAPATATDNGNGAASPDSEDCGSTSNNGGKGHSGLEDVMRDIGEVRTGPCVQSAMQWGSKCRGTGRLGAGLGREGRGGGGLLSFC